MADVFDRTISCMPWKVLTMVPLTYSDTVHRSAHRIEFYFLWLILHETLRVVTPSWVLIHNAIRTNWRYLAGEVWGEWWSRSLDSSGLYSAMAVKPLHSQAALMNNTRDFPNPSRLLSKFPSRKMHLNILSRVWRIRRGLDWQLDLLDWTQLHNSWLHLTVHCKTHTHTHTHSLIFLVLVCLH
jgi:hypothetical protein